MERSISQHDQIKKFIVQTLNERGINAVEERSNRSSGWRADVYADTGVRKVVFEVQISPQSIRATEERQRKYLQDGITACWLFTKDFEGWEEHPRLPLFKMLETDDGILVSLKDRRDVKLGDFVTAFAEDRIQFRTEATPARIQPVQIIYYPMKCWKCKEDSVYFKVDGAFKSHCACKIHEEEIMWTAQKVEFMPEILSAARKFAANRLPLGEIKERQSKTVEHSYLSFGCFHCDSIFGDWFIMKDQLEYIYDKPDFEKFDTEIDALHIKAVNMNHWCFPENGKFCRF